jgi:hypothetical protein
MGLSKEAIEEFKRIYQEEFGKEISDKEAKEMGGSLLSLFKIICRPLPQDDKEDGKEPEVR